MSALISPADDDQRLSYTQCSMLTIVGVIVGKDVSLLGVGLGRSDVESRLIVEVDNLELPSIDWSLFVSKADGTRK